jgi:GNAT superfamily N-acetyltransferase
MTGPCPIDRLTRADEGAAVAALASAFIDYPLLVALCPDAADRPRVTEAFCRYLVRLSLGRGGVYATRDRAAVACTWPVGAEWPSLWAGVRAGGLGLFWRMGWWRSRFLLRLERELDAARRQHVPGPHWYVTLLGVRPEARGKGLSRAVLRPVFEAADRAGVPVYLETVPEANVAIYERLGFALRGHRVLRVGLHNWELVREPPPPNRGPGAGG